MYFKQHIDNCMLKPTKSHAHERKLRSTLESDKSSLQFVFSLPLNSQYWTHIQAVLVFRCNITFLKLQIGLGDILLFFVFVSILCRMASTSSIVHET